MSLQFMIGGSGSGKTWQLHQYIMKQSLENPGREIIVIVPEQFTMETQSALSALHPGHSVFGIDIVSFERLAYRVFEELNCMPKTVLDDTGKSMLIRKTCGRCEKELEIYKRHLNRAGFIEELKSVMSEFAQYKIDKEKLSRTIHHSEIKPLLARKLHDLELLSDAFRSAMDPDTIPAEELLHRLCSVLTRSERVKNTIVAIDGFTGFTPAQYDVIHLLLTLTDQVIVTVTMDPDYYPYKKNLQSDLFALSRKTIGKLSEMAEELGVKRDEDLLLAGHRNDRYAASEELRFLQRHLLRRTDRPWTEDMKDIKLLAAPTAKDECRFIGDEIHRLVNEKGYRYREIAIVCGSLEQYVPLLERAMADAEIPLFMDDKRNLLTNPVVEAMRAVLDVIEKDFTYDTVFRYLKCGFTVVPEDVLFEVENYCLARGIRGHKKWEQEWEKLYSHADHINLVELNEARETIIRPVLKLREALKAKGATVRDMTEALYNWLTECKAEEVLTAMSERFEELGEYSLSAEYAQAFGQLMELFDRMAGLLGDEVLPLKSYREILETGCREIRVGVIPAAIDRVLVGDVQRSRLAGIRALFFLGVNDGNIPAPGKNGGLLSELDREDLKNYMELSPTRRESSLTDKFYFYLTLTKPSEKLYISYASADERGEGKLPSSYLGYLTSIFQTLTVTEIGESTGLPYTMTMAMKQLSEGFDAYRESGDTEVWFHLIRFLSQNKELETLVERMEQAALEPYRGDHISKAVARVLYGDQISGSVSRLEQYAKCAYAHFLKYGLYLVKRQEFAFDVMDRGNVFHKAIEMIFTRADEEGIVLYELKAAERRALCREAIHAASEEQGGVLSSTKRNEYQLARMEEILERTMWVLGEQLKAGDFSPAYFELNFNAAGNKALEITLSDTEKMRLTGKIDRVDICEDEDQVFVKVIDYKTGAKIVDMNEIYYGLSIQLVVYLNALIEQEKRRHPGKEIVPAALLYSHVDDPMLSRDEAGSDPDKVFMEKLRPDGFVNIDPVVMSHLEREPDPDKKSKYLPISRKGGEITPNFRLLTGPQFEALKDFVTRRMSEFGRQIADGCADAHPFRLKENNGCKYCELKSICGFDRKGNGYSYRSLNRLKAEDIWQEILENEEEGEEES